MAARIVGGPRKLRALLGLRSAEVASWLAGREEPPHEVLLQATELILDELDAGGARLRSAARRTTKAQVVEVRPRASRRK